MTPPGDHQRDSDAEAADGVARQLAALGQEPAPPDVLQRLDAVLEAQQGSSPSRPRRVWWRRRSLVVAGLAPILLIGVVVVVGLRGQSRPAASNTAASAGQALPAQVPAASAPAPTATAANDFTQAAGSSAETSTNPASTPAAAPSRTGAQVATTAAAAPLENAARAAYDAARRMLLLREHHH